MKKSPLSKTRNTGAITFQRLRNKISKCSVFALTGEDPSLPQILTLIITLLLDGSSKNSKHRGSSILERGLLCFLLLKISLVQIMTDPQEKDLALRSRL